MIKVDGEKISQDGTALSGIFVKGSKLDQCIGKLVRWVETHLFHRLGRTFQCIALFICIVGTVASVIAGIVLLIASYNVYWLENLYRTLGCTFLLAGPLVFWLSSLMLYAFGELIDRARSIDQTLKAQNGMAPVEPEAPEQEVEASASEEPVRPA